MTGLRPHTKNYGQEARDTLGRAFSRAREAAGYPSRPAFARASGVGKTSLWKLETGIPVSASVYEAAARALPHWTEDTPRIILEGGSIPSNDSLPAPPESQQPIIAVYNEEERTLAYALADLDYTVDEINEHLELRRARIRSQSGMDVGQVGESSA